MPSQRNQNLEQQLKLIIGDIVSKYVFRFLYIFGTIIFITGGWITKNQIEISSLQKTVASQDAKITANDKLSIQHEWMVINHESRLNKLESKPSK